MGNIVDSLNEERALSLIWRERDPGVDLTCEV